ncbi:hypothetical protein CEB3_c07680 [Peptococcaceae bacterium CEB3]|nr:hypothetical protein CEB3_c07680 [Peptococcaceae bacterium CEB3]
MKESLTMKELRQTRLKHYEATWNMTREEKIKYINAKGEEAKRRIDELKK